MRQVQRLHDGVINESWVVSKASDEISGNCEGPS